MPNFPHLSDTSFPDASNVNVYQFRNTFDYTRWSEKTKIKLCNVLWNSSYADVVKWDTDALRDTWFNNLSDTWTMELRTAARVVPDGFVKLPIPYDVMARYNYLFIDMPIATSANNMIDYEKSSGIKRWYFFVERIEYLSPNATQVYISLDVWTNFQNRIDIPYMMLERGHAPVAATDTDTYLANPIANNRYLLAPDVNFDKSTITKSSSYVPFGNGKKYVCIASTCAPNQIASLGLVSQSSTYNPNGTISYSDYDARYGHQLTVNGYGIGNGYDYSDARTPASVGYSSGNIANNLTVYAIEASEVYGNNATYYQDVVKYCPQFLNTVKACFVVDENCLTLGSSFEFAGHTIYLCTAKSRTLLTKALAKADFNYPSNLQRFAKLYTSPYAQLEITDNNGKTVEVKIEETSTMTVKSVVSVAFPYINERVYVDGIGGTGSNSYSWMDLKDVSHSHNMPNSDWFKYCFDWEIPTFGLFMDGETAFMLNSFNRNVKNARQSALVDYHCTMRSANTAFENACDQANTAYVNTTATNATNNTNALDEHETANTNAHATNDASYINVAGGTAHDGTTIAGTSLTDWRNTNTAVSGDNLISENTVYSLRQDAINTGTFLDGMNAIQRNLYQDNLFAEEGYMTAVYQAGVDMKQLTTSNALIGNIVGATTSFAKGDYGSVANGLTGALQTGIALEIALTNDGTLYNAALSANTEKLKIINAHQFGVHTPYYVPGLSQPEVQGANIANRRDEAIRSQEYVNDVLNRQTSGNPGVRISNANRTKTTANETAKNTTDTANANADRTQATGDLNSSRSKATADLNAERTQLNVKENARYTRHDVEELNAKETLENGKRVAMAAVSDAKNAKPVELCKASGDPTPDAMQTRGIQIKVKTQSDSAIRQAGDTFARFGYALNQVWDVATSGLKLMNHFTYWKASEIWIDDAEASNNAVNTFIRDMFLKGVTVWNDPTRIGKVSVYAN